MLRFFSKDCSVSEVAFDSTYYQSLDLMWDAINKLTKILIDAGYEVHTMYEDCNIYVVRFINSKNYELGGNQFAIIGEDECELLMNVKLDEVTETVCDTECCSGIEEND